MTTEAEIFAVDFAALSREIAMDIFPLAQILELHKLSDEEWSRISSNVRFQTMLEQMIREWNSAANTRERVRIKAATGLESVLETYIQEIVDVSIPLTQRVEAGKFLARLGELDGAINGELGERFSITLNIGATHRAVETELPLKGEQALVIDHVD